MDRIETANQVMIEIADANVVVMSDNREVDMK